MTVRLHDLLIADIIAALDEAGRAEHELVAQLDALRALADPLVARGYTATVNTALAPFQNAIERHKRESTNIVVALHNPMNDVHDLTVILARAEHCKHETRRTAHGCRKRSPKLDPRREIALRGAIERTATSLREELTTLAAMCAKASNDDEQTAKAYCAVLRDLRHFDPTKETHDLKTLRLSLETLLMLRKRIRLICECLTPE